MTLSPEELRRLTYVRMRYQWRKRYDTLIVALNVALVLAITFMVAALVFLVFG